MIVALLAVPSILIVVAAVVKIRAAARKIDEILADELAPPNPGTVSRPPVSAPQQVDEVLSRKA